MAGKTRLYCTTKGNPIRFCSVSLSWEHILLIQHNHTESLKFYVKHISVGENYISYNQ